MNIPEFTNPTYCFELFTGMTKSVDDIEVIEAHYISSGLEATIKDKYDKQLYKITIQPKAVKQ